MNLKKFQNSQCSGIDMNWKRQKVIGAVLHGKLWYLMLECGATTTRPARYHRPFLGCFYGNATLIKPKYVKCFCEKCRN